MTVPLEVLQLYSGMDGDDMLQILAPDMDKKARKRALKAQKQISEPNIWSRSEPSQVSGAFLKASSARAARSRSRPIAQKASQARNLFALQSSVWASNPLA